METQTLLDKYSCLLDELKQTTQPQLADQLKAFPNYADRNETLVEGLEEMIEVLEGLIPLIKKDEAEH